MRTIFLLFLFYLVSQSAFEFTCLSQKNEASQKIRIDSIDIQKNWISWDRIILNELGFKEGDTVNFGQLDIAMMKIWNINNFVDVGYEIITDSIGENLLQITARDAIRFYPLIGIDYSSKNDYHINLGFGDENFLGSNIKLRGAVGLTNIGNSFDFRISLPRQLLYKNMTFSFGFVKGKETKQKIEKEIIYNANNEIDSVEYNTLMLAPFDKMEIYGSVGNPWHLDYHYRFSPNLSWRYARHVTDLSLIDNPDDLQLVPEPYNFHMLSFGISESIGMINRKRHRKDGYVISAGFGYSFGLNEETPNWYSLSMYGEYDKIFNNILQFTGWFRTAYTNASHPAYVLMKGSSDVLGLRQGEIYGNAYYSTYMGMHFTWINSRWIAVENAYFFNFGAGSEQYLTLFGTKPKWAIGTSFAFQIPQVPLIAFKLTFMYAGPGSNWFKFNL